MWDPGQYLQFADERSRPFFDLLGQVRAQDPGLVVDLGCGPGQLTAALADRWPDADVRGIDSSAEMIETARQRPAAGRLSFALADLRDWEPARPVDVITANAVLQWVPDHLKLLTRWVGQLSDGGWLAFQLPGNFDQPGHVVLREMAGSDRWRPLLAGVSLNRQASDPAPVRGPAGQGWLCRRCVGDDLPACAPGPRSGARLVQGLGPSARARGARARAGGAIPRGLRRPDAPGLSGGAVWHDPAVPAGLCRRPTQLSAQWPGRASAPATRGRWVRNPRGAA